MSASFMSRCGIDCKACDCRENTNCPGCVAAEGKPFWGECAIAECCVSKDLEHCGQCGDFPCNALNEYAYDPESGDNGKRICNLKVWNEKGYDAWRQTQQINEQSGFKDI